MTASFRTRLASVYASLPGAEVSDPWGGGHDAWKVGGKMFACIGAVERGVSVKTPDVETAGILIDVGIGRRAPYFHRSLFNLPEDVDDAELAHRLRISGSSGRSCLKRHGPHAIRWTRRDDPSVGRAGAIRNRFDSLLVMCTVPPTAKLPWRPT